MATKKDKPNSKRQDTRINLKDVDIGDVLKEVTKVKPEPKDEGNRQDEGKNRAQP